MKEIGREKEQQYKQEYGQELGLALHMAREAGKEILRHYESSVTVETKRDNTPVTIADRNAEEIIRRLMEKETPGYGIIGEEFGSSAGSQPRQWVIDPIDGTKAFIHGVPLFGTLIALLENGAPIVGVVAMPALGRTLWATRGGGAYVDGAPCRVSAVARLDEALLLDGSSMTMERLGYAEPWTRLRSRSKLSRGWGDCYGHFLVATGRAEVMADPVVEIWDVAPLAIILPEAGGCFTSFLGNPSILERSGISTNGVLHNEVLKEFQPYVNIATN